VDVVITHQNLMERSMLLLKEVEVPHRVKMIHISKNTHKTYWGQKWVVGSCLWTMGLVGAG